ncbi:MAG: 4-amino-4-deoxychorismate lyase [Flavobacteriales bacterium]
MNAQVANKAFCDGEVLELSSLADRSFAYGDGLFETMRCEQGNVPLLRFHIARLKYSCERMSMNFSESSFLAYLAQCLDCAPAQSIIKCIYVRKDSLRASYPSLPSSSTCYFQYTPLQSRDSWRNGVDLIFAAKPLADNVLLSGLKHTSRLSYILALGGVQPTSKQEVLFVDDKAQICESMHHNIFFISKETLFTPTLEMVGVHGIMRSYVLDSIANEMDLKTQCCNILVDDLSGFDGAILTNAIDGALRINSIGSHTYNCSDNADKLCERLQASFLS